MRIFLENCLYMLVLINPISKIFILMTLGKERSKEEMATLINKSSFVACLILLGLGISGNFILSEIFHVQLYSFKIAGGAVVFFTGFTALTKGVFFETDDKKKFEDISIVPLAAPMIAGPASIAAAISLNKEYGLISASACIIIAITTNHLIMILNRVVSNWIIRYHVMGALIRITGLIVASIAVQMILSGIIDFVKSSF